MAQWKAITAKIPKNVNAFKDELAKEFSNAPTQKESVIFGAWSDFTEFVAPFSAKNKPTIEDKVTVKGNEISAFVGVTSNWTKGKKI